MTNKNILLDDWQEQILAHDGNILLATGRQVGKTMTFSIKCCKEMLEKPNTRIVTVSLTEDQAKLIIIMILDFLERNNKRDIKMGKDKPTQNKIVLKNGSQIIARPVGTTGDALRGFTADILYLDEVSRFSSLILTAARPVLLTTGGKIWMSSTFYGKQGFFYEQYEACRNGEGRFKVFHKSSEDVIFNRPISEGWSETQKANAIEYLKQEKATMSELAYGQEYLGLPLDDLRQFFSDELIEKSCILKRDPQLQGEKFMGVDIARQGKDESSFEVLTKIEDKLYHIESITTVKTFTTETEQRIIDMDSQYSFEKIGIDAGSGSLGVGVFDHLRELTQLKRKIVAMNNREIALERDGSSSQRLRKEDFYDNLKAMMERGDIKLLNDEKVRLSLKSVQWMFTKNIEGQEDEQSKIKIFGKYTHIVEGLTRAAELGKGKGSNIWISSIKAW